MKAHQYTAFFLLYCRNLIAQFDKLFLRTLKNSTPEDQTERKNVIFETPETPWAKKKNRNFETQESPKNDTSRPIKNRASEISRSSQNFLRPTFFEPFLYPFILPKESLRFY